MENIIIATASTAPKSKEEAYRRIKNISMDECEGAPAKYYYEAIMDFLTDGEFSRDWALDLAFMLAFTAGIQEGKRRERSRRRRH